MRTTKGVEGSSHLSQPIERRAEALYVVFWPHVGMGEIFNHLLQVHIEGHAFQLRLLSQSRFDSGFSSSLTLMMTSSGFDSIIPCYNGRLARNTAILFGPICATAPVRGFRTFRPERRED